MRYSLLSRFEGGLLGGAIAAEKGRRPQEGQPGTAARALQESAIASLVRCGRFEPEDWLAATENSHPSLLQQQGSLKTSEVAVAMVPIALFCHDHRASLHASAIAAAELWLPAGTNADELLLWADAIALILRETLPAPNLLDRLLALAADPAAPGLETLKSLALDRDRPLKDLARSASPPSPLALALYCFAATAEDFSLSLDRALGISALSPLTAILVGAIAGLYNSSSALPPRPGIDPSPLERSRHQARQLFAAWAGTYRPDGRQSNGSVVAGAGMLQARTSLKIPSGESPAP